MRNKKSIKKIHNIPFASHFLFSMQRAKNKCSDIKKAIVRYELHRAAWHRSVIANLFRTFPKFISPFSFL